MLHSPDGSPLPTNIIPMTHDAITFVSTTYHGRTFRFCIRGTGPMYEVSFEHDFDGELGESFSPGRMPHRAWFVIAPESAAEPEVLQEFLYPQLVAIHEREIAPRKLVAV